MLFALMACAACAALGLSYGMKRVWAIQRIEAGGGAVILIHEADERRDQQPWLDGLVGRGFWSSVKLVDLTQCVEPAPLLRRVGDLPELDALLVTGNSVGDAETEAIRGLRHVRRLSLAGTALTDQGAEFLPLSGQLEELDLSGTAITDVGVRRLQRAPNLITLGLANTAIGDDCLSHLACPRLRGLFLNGTRVSNGGLPSIARFAELEMLALNDTLVSESGLPVLAPLRMLRQLLIGDCQLDATRASHALSSQLPDLRIEAIPCRQQTTGSTQ